MRSEIVEVTLSNRVAHGIHIAHYCIVFSTYSGKNALLFFGKEKRHISLDNTRF